MYPLYICITVITRCKSATTSPPLRSKLSCAPLGLSSRSHGQRHLIRDGRLQQSAKARPSDMHSFRHLFDSREDPRELPVWLTIIPTVEDLPS